jgi:glycosyltransferase involved in cell wall biosynthesis
VPPPPSLSLSLLLLTSLRSLKQKVVDLGLSGKVFFNESFFSDEDLWSALSSADVYLNSYTDEVASVSGQPRLPLPHLSLFPGTLIMAMGLGIPCLSTPYPFAREMFQDHRGGVLVPFRDAVAITRALGYLLDDEERARRIGRRGQEITVSWNEVGRRYVELIYPPRSASPTAGGGTMES